jgi:hypothetical protein
VSLDNQIQIQNQILNAVIDSNTNFNQNQNNYYDISYVGESNQHYFNQNFVNQANFAEDYHLNQQNILAKIEEIS